MKTKNKIIISLLLLSPVLGELLSGSSPPLVFFSPLAFILMVLLYGGGTLLIREAKVGWRLQWSVIFLGVAYGILEEGTIIQSFFNPGHIDLGKLSGYGMYAGVQWPWAIMLAVYHATVSTLIPIAIVDLMWPEYKDIKALDYKGCLAALGGLLLVLLLCWLRIFIVKTNDPVYGAYHANIILVTASLALVVLCLFLAYKWRNSRVLSGVKLWPRGLFGVAGFIYIPVALCPVVPMCAKGVPAPVAVGYLIISSAVILWFIFQQVFNKDITDRHMLSLISGAVLFWIILAPLQEFSPGNNPDSTKGMASVGVISLLLLFVWRRKVLKKINTAFINKP